MITSHSLRQLHVQALSVAGLGIGIVITAVGHAEMESRQITFAPHGHILTNIGVWSPDSQWIVYDVRSDPAGEKFDGDRIERVHVPTGRVEVLFQSQNGASCGVVTHNPVDDRVVFIHGPEFPDESWSYSAFHRRGVFLPAIFAANQHRLPHNLDARNVVPPYTPGALRGGTHVHVYSGDGEWVSFTYEDHVLATVADGVDAQRNQRNVGVAVPLGPVRVPASHPRNHDGQCFSVLVTRTVDQARPGSDEIERAYEDAWVGRDGYLRVDGGRQRRALAFLGDVRDERGGIVTELFVVDLPDDVTQRGADPLEGTLTRRPAPPAGTVQRRLTHTTERRYPGIQGVRHWPRSCADGSCIAFLMRDDQRHVQLWTIGPEGGQPQQITQHPFDVASAFSWSPAGDVIAYIADGSVFVTRVANQTSERLTMPIGRSVEADHELGTPRPEACVFAPDGKSIAYVRSVKTSDGVYNQVFVVQVALGE